MPVHEPNNLAEYKQIIRTKAKVAVMFGAVWSAPSQMMNPEFKKYSGEYPGITFLYVDIDQSPDIHPYEKVTAVPTFLFFHNGQRVDQFIGPDRYAVKRNLDKLNAR